MPIHEPEAGLGWDERSALDPLAAVLDHQDAKGHKNRFIDLLQRDALDRVLGSVSGAGVLDFGCGTGRLLTHLRGRGARVVGVEAEPAMAAVAARAAGRCVAVFDGATLPIRPRHVDVALSVGVLQYFAGPLLDDAIAALRDVLVPGGRVVAIEQVATGGLGRGATVERYQDALRGAGLSTDEPLPIRRGRSPIMRVAERLAPVSRSRAAARLAQFEARARGTRSLTRGRYADVLFVGRLGA